MQFFMVILSALTLAGFTSAQAETLTCRSKTDSSFSLKAAPPRLATTPPSLKAEIKESAFDKEHFTLKAAPRGAALNYSDYWNPKAFWLSLGDFKGEGRYEAATLTFVDNGKTKTHELVCQLKGPIAFQNYCIKTEGNDPQKNLFTSARDRRQELFLSTVTCEGIDLNAEDEKGCTPLLVLAHPECGSGEFDPIGNQDIKDMVAALADAWVELDRVDPISKETALIKLARIQDLDSVKILIGAGASVNAQDKEGMTALMRAVETGYYRLAEALVLANADVSLKNAKGLTALDLAKINKLAPRFRELLSGANLVVVQGDQAGTCSPMNLTLALNMPNRIVLKTQNPMLMLDAKELGISLMATSGQDASQLVNPTAAGTYRMTCGPSMSGGNPQGTIVVQ
ncbi:MAG TPA: ankyrin repeat domain-containing protein [Bdellovibrionales bacterium]|nr:ankyrin repeat domain-containing protein [Bdellovibrionales bacterium]